MASLFSRQKSADASIVRSIHAWADCFGLGKTKTLSGPTRIQASSRLQNSVEARKEILQQIHSQFVLDVMQEMGVKIVCDASPYSLLTALTVRSGSKCKIVMCPRDFDVLDLEQFYLEPNTEIYTKGTLRGLLRGRPIWRLDLGNHPVFVADEPGYYNIEFNPATQVYTFAYTLIRPCIVQVDICK